MACTYASVEIQRTPELRVFKKCLFYDKTCAEVRASRMCPLLRRAAREQPLAPTIGAPATDRDVLSDELRRIDSIPVTTGQIRSRETGRIETPKKIEEPKPEGPSDAELLKAELSDFMNKIETKREKPSTPKRTAARKRKVDE
nr:hypothetical protein [Candidatus Njordarchaeota archaeon]